MLTYRIDDSILVLVAVGTPTADQRQAVFEAIRNDPLVRPGSPVLIDASQADRVGSLPVVQERAHLLVELLGTKMGSVCAVVVPPSLAGEALYFQAAGGELGVRVGLFADEDSARRWLGGHR